MASAGSIFALVASLGCGAPALGALAAPALAQSGDALERTGGWQLSAADSNRACHILLRADEDGKERSVGMPAGCRRALPILRTIHGWRAPSGDSVELGDATGAPVLRFAPAADRTLTARGPNGETYELVAAPDPGQEAVVDPAPKSYVPALDPNDLMAATRPRAAPGFAAAPGGAQQVAANASRERGRAAAGPPARASEVAGRYAILREDARDTGCMLTLESNARGPRGTRRAILAPACRDQGIVIFDPVGWQIDRDNHLVLTARKGHKAQFDRAPDGTWKKDPKEGGKPLSFRKL
jgi:hypothetical protein